MSRQIINPILPGFHPDPSIIRVGNDYYIATSTFEWFPGVRIHHSTDLINWKPLGHVLTRQSQLDMLGAPDSCGVWAPCLSYDKGIFYLVYSNVSSFDGPWKDTPNYMVTSESINGPWSEPIFLMSRGFDVSLFHDLDGRKWLANMVVDHRNAKFFGGIELQEWDPTTQKLIGDVHPIFPGTELCCTEGPHIYHRNGWYYLITAEGGTEYGHAVTVARSKTITGPYEVHPENPIFTARNTPEELFQRTGHADLVFTPEDKCYAVYLASRPLKPNRRCILGRETVIEQVEWRADDWPYAASGHKTTRTELPPPHSANEECNTAGTTSVFDHFNEDKLCVHWQTLRIPAEESWISLKERTSHLRLKGRESLCSTKRQSFLARRLQSTNAEAACQIEFSPDNFQQMAGLVCYYNTSHFHYLYISIDESNNKKCKLNIISNNNGDASEPLIDYISFDKTAPLLLKVHVDNNNIKFYCSLNTVKPEWKSVGPVLDGSILSDDYVREGGSRYRPAFTGTFIGVSCQDLSGLQKHADFDWFSYKDL